MRGTSYNHRSFGPAPCAGCDGHGREVAGQLVVGGGLLEENVQQLQVRLCCGFRYSWKGETPIPRREKRVSTLVLPLAIVFLHMYTPENHVFDNSSSAFFLSIAYLRARVVAEEGRDKSMQIRRG